MSQALKLATLIPETESPRSKDRKVPPFVGSRTPFGRVHVHEQNVGPKSLSELILDAARIAPGILTTIAKENFGHRAL
jgi:hypothetical protein